MGTREAPWAIMSNKKSLSAAAAAWAPPKKKTVLRAAAAAWAPSFGGNHNAKKEEQKRKEQEEAKRKQEEQKKREAEEKARIEKQKEQERLRREEEKRLEEEERERQRLAEEEARRKQEEEKKRLEEERRQEEERKEKERKIQEQRERERKRKAEERKKRLAQDPNTSTKDRKYSRKYLLQFEELCRAPPKDLDPKFKAAMNNSTIRYSRARSSTGSGGGDQWRNKNSGNRSTSRRTQRDAGYNNYNDKSYNYNNTNRRPNNRRPGKGRNQRNNRNQNSRPMDIEIKELEVTENRYKIVKNKAELEEDELLKRKINSILNKLTPEKFEKLCGQFDQLDINNRERLQWVVDSVFEKALINPIHTPTYADFCKRLAGQGKQFEGNITFKKVLLNCCQQEFEKDHEAERKKIEEKQTEEEKLEAEIKHKQRRIGTIAFIGELFCRGLIGKKNYLCVLQLFARPRGSG